jgi:hypothetical protein
LDVLSPALVLQYSQAVTHLDVDRDGLPLGITATAEPVDVVPWHLLADEPDMRMAKDILMSPHAQRFHNECTSWVRR